MSILGFVTPWMLAALPAVGVPVLIHFLTRPRPRVIRYPTLRFLVEAGSGRQALQRLKVIVLLALRCLAVAALVFTFARPFLKEPGAEALPGAKRRVVLLVDASMSMRAARGGVSLFTRACAETAELLSGLEPGSQAGVVFVGERPRAVLPAISENTDELHRALASARATMELGRPELALAAAERMLGGRREGEGAGSIYILSDFQRTNWGALQTWLARGRARAARANVFLRPVTDAARKVGTSRGPDDAAVPNVAITSVEITPAEPVAGESVEVTARVFNCTAEPRTEIVGLVVEGEGVGLEAKLALRAFSSGGAVFWFELPRPGTFPGTVRVAADDLGEDDRRYFAVRVREALDVLVVSDSPPDDTMSAAFFVSTALAPSARAGTGLTVLRRRSQDTEQSAIDRSDVIVIAAPATLPARVAEAVAARVTAGGQLVILLDGPTSKGILGALAGASGGVISAPFRPAGEFRCSGPESEGQPLGGSELASGVLELFSDPAQGSLAGVVFRRHLRTEVLPDRKGEVLVYHADGSAAVALSSAGRGTAVYVNLPMTPDGGNLVGRGVFPALMAEIMRSLRRAGGRHQVHPGRVWSLDVPVPSASREETGYRVVTRGRPDGGDAEIPFTAVALGRFARLSLPPVEAPGHYLVYHASDRTGPPAAVGVVNVDPRESDTRELPLSHAAGPLAPGAVTVVAGEGGLRLGGAVRRLWPVFAALAAGFIAAEMALLALWRGPGREAPAVRYVTSGSRPRRAEPAGGRRTA